MSKLSPIVLVSVILSVAYPQKDGLPLRSDHTPPASMVGADVNRDTPAQIVDAAIHRFDHEVDEALHAFETALSDRMEAFRKSVRQTIDPVIVDSVTRRALVRLASRMAWDMVRNDRLAEIWIQDTFEAPLLPILIEFEADIGQIQSRYILALDRAWTRLETSLLAALEGDAIGINEHGAGAALVPARIGTTVHAEGVHTGIFVVLGSVSVAIDAAAFLKSWPSTASGAGHALQAGQTFLVRNGPRQALAHVLHPIARKFAARLATSAAVSAADGPLPIGKIVGIATAGVFTLWTAWEFYHLAEDARLRIQAGVDESFLYLRNDVKENILLPAREEAGQRKQTVRSARDDLAAAIADEMGGKR